MVAVWHVRSDRSSLLALAVCYSGSGLPAEESPPEKPHVFMKQAAKQPLTQTDSLKKDQNMKT